MWWVPLRAARLVAHILRGIYITRRQNKRDPARQAELVRAWHEKVLRILNIEIHVQGSLPENAPQLWVSNHISWLDIPLLGSLAPHAVFVSKQEVRSWPVIGNLAAAAGTLFMQRGSGSEGARAAIAEGLLSGRHIVIFPEGTTTDGHKVKRFHARLFQTAIDCRASVRPIAIRYRLPDGRLARSAAYIDNDHILGSIGRILATRRLIAEVYLLDTIDTHESTTRNQLAELAQHRISQVIRPPFTR